MNPIKDTGDPTQEGTPEQGRQTVAVAVMSATGVGGVGAGGGEGGNGNNDANDSDLSSGSLTPIKVGRFKMCVTQAL